AFITWIVATRGSRISSLPAAPTSGGWRDNRQEGERAVMAKPPRLMLRAKDATDMDIIASVLQDALVPMTEATFIRRDRRFAMVVNRFMWERREQAEAEAAARPGRTADSGEADSEEARDAAFHEADPRPTYYRTHCGV